VSGDTGWNGDLDADVGISVEVDYTALLDFGSEEQDDGGETAQLTDIAELVLDGGLGSGSEAAGEILGVGEDLNEG
jgi:hypothetical protein